MRTLKVNDFFCGCGGMGIAFKDAGFEVAGAWDFDKYAVQTYRANVGEHVRQQDIRGMAYKDIPKADVWAFGFPCQDLSVAGKQRGMGLKCTGCGEELYIKPEDYQNNALCPYCGGRDFKATSRSGCFFEIMRLLEETEENAPENMPAVIIAENVKGLKPYLPMVSLEYVRHGYTAHAQIFNSKYWGVAQNRERYAIVGTRDRLGLHFTFPEEQHEFVPKLSSQLEKDVDGKYFLPDGKAKTIIAQAAERINLENCHACITPDRLNKKQNGPRAKEEEEPMFTLTTHPQGVITRTPRAVKLQNSNMRGRRVKGPEEAAFSVTAGDIDGVIIMQDRENVEGSGGGAGIPVQTPVKVIDKGNIVSKVEDISPCLMARDCKGFSNKAESIVVIEKQLRARKLTPKEYGILQAFPMGDWKQVVSDRQAYKQFGNAVTVTVFTAIAKEIKKSILQSENRGDSSRKAGVGNMAIKDLIAVLAQSERIKVIKGEKELYMGYIANFTPYEVFAGIKDSAVKKLYYHMELRHKRYEELGLEAPMHPGQVPDYSFSDLQMTSYYTIEI